VREVPVAGGRKIDALADRRALDLVVDDLLQRALGGGLRQAGLLAGLAQLSTARRRNRR
jgi:hypothetical protein